MKLRLDKTAAPSTGVSLTRVIAWVAACLGGSFAASADQATVAWHFTQSPVGFFLDSAAASPAAGGRSAGSKEVSKAPSPTVFAGKGDHLSDLSEVMRQVSSAGAGSWLVWNETRHLLIARGEPSVLLHVEQLSRFAGQLEVVAVTLDWYQGLHPDLEAKPDRRVEMVTDQMGRARCYWEAPHGSLDSGPITAVDCDLFNLGWASDRYYTATNLGVSWAERFEGKNWGWAMNPSVQMEDLISHPMVVLKTPSPSGRDWTITARAQRRLIDGTPWSEARWVEEAGNAAVLLPGKADQRVATNTSVMVDGHTRRLDIFRIEDLLALLLPDPPAPGAEVFSPNPLNLPVPLRFEVPESLIDVKKLLQKSGVQFADEDIAGYGGGRLYVVSESTRALAGIEDLLSGIFHCRKDQVAVGLRISREGEGGDPGHRLMMASYSGGTLNCWERGTDGKEAEDPLLHWGVHPALYQNTVSLRQELCLPASITGTAVEANGESEMAVGNDTVFQTVESAGTKTTLSVQVDVQDPHETETP